MGGWIRDILLNRPPVYYVIAVLENPEKFAYKIAARIQGRLVKIGKAGKLIFRVVSGSHVFDIAPVSGSSIGEDLEQRDFTINALACDLSSGEIIDRIGGLKDLREKKVRMVSKDAFRKDPIRLLRAFRMGAVLNFKIEPQTVSTIRKNAGLIRNSAGERVRTELMGLLRAPNSHGYLNQMAETGLLSALLPEIESLKGYYPDGHHGYDLFRHTLNAYHHLESLLNEKESFLPQLSDQFHSLIHKDYLAPLKWALVLHELGKPEFKKNDAAGPNYFIDYAQKSADIAKKICHRFRFSNREKDFVDGIIRSHIRPLGLYKTRQNNHFPDRLIRFFLKCGSHTPYLLLHFLAVVEGNKIARETEDFREFVKDTFRTYCLTYQPMQKAPPLITGDDLIYEFGLTPSPLFKTILARVEEARLTKRIKTRAAALKLVKKIGHLKHP